ncbi:DNA annealing helicase and endonuclease ZRANB3 isoform X3 [Latimeria chalumnae]|uniref:DNA annealing helicase and endonuclease ZRANB3 isoform X3 n=1 Tax=Latimeria chalumnae TaxID=7897 RepID=UPI00313C341E
MAETQGDCQSVVQVKKSKNEFDDQLLLLPEKLRQRLLPFQREGVRFALEKAGRCMIADEMGLGKTIQAIAVACFYREEWPLLIIVPSSLKYPWIEEMEKWVPELNPDDFNLIENKTDIGKIPTSKVTILGYGLLTTDARMLVDALCKQNFEVVIVDESHYMKSRNAARSKILVPIVQNASRAILLTGTPALSRPEELFMQIDALYPRRFGTWSSYAKQYCNAHVRYFGKRVQWDCKGASNLDELHKRLNSIMIRRLKDEVLTQLPPKIKQRIPFDLPKEAAKAGAVKDYIKMLLENEKLKFLVFAHHLTMLQACTEAVIECKGRYIRIDGSVPSLERIHLVHQFQNDPDTRVAILSLKAAGQGLTFTAATHVVFAELYWDPGHIKQAEDRAHRIGQSSSVHVHYLIAKGTLDMLMWGMLNRKTSVTSSTLNGKKTRMQVEEGDKDKWDFLNFSYAWTPNESIQETKDEVFFSHFEKEKQHDIRTFFSSKPDAEKHKRTSLQLAVEPPSVFSKEEENAGCCAAVQEKENEYEASDVSTEHREMTSGKTLQEADLEPETKRFRLLNTPVQSSLSKPKRKSWNGKTHSPFSKQKKQGFSEGSTLKSGSMTCSEKAWSCVSCTYTNSSLLPYCEICETSRNSTASTNSEEAKSEIRCRKTQNEKAKYFKRTGENDCIIISNSEQEGENDTPPNTEQSSTQETTEIKSCNTSEPDAKSITLTDENKQSEQMVDFHENAIPLSEGFLFCASRNTDRIYLYTKDRQPLSCNFIPLDIKLENWDDLPEMFAQKQNRIMILRFVREWCSLTTMKQRMIRKSGQIFHSPILASEEIFKEQRRKTTAKRYLTKEDVAAAALNKVQNDGGSVRVVAKESAFFLKKKPDSIGGKTSGTHNRIPLNYDNQTDIPTTSLDPGEEIAEGSLGKGYLQAVDKEGNPLCLCCQGQTVKVDLQRSSTAWDTRFCSQKCQEGFLIQSNQGYMRAKVFEIEHGICQQCGLNAQQLYLRVRDAPKIKRKELLDGTWMSQISLNQLNEMIRNPTEGQFWQADHIRAVYSGGGQCSLENLQTLCTACHKEKTTKQAKERSQMKRFSAASKYGSDITTFFKKAPCRSRTFSP